MQVELKFEKSDLCKKIFNKFAVRKLLKYNIWK